MTTLQKTGNLAGTDAKTRLPTRTWFAESKVGQVEVSWLTARRVVAVVAVKVSTLERLERPRRLDWFSVRRQVNFTDKVDWNFL